MWRGVGLLILPSRGVAHRAPLRRPPFHPRAQFDHVIAPRTAPSPTPTPPRKAPC